MRGRIAGPSSARLFPSRSSVVEMPLTMSVVLACPLTFLILVVLFDKIFGSNFFKGIYLLKEEVISFSLVGLKPFNSKVHP